MINRRDDGIKRVVVGGLPTAVISKEKLASVMVADCMSARKDPSFIPKLVFSSNGQGVSLAGESKTFMETMLQADVIHADGHSVYAASRLTSYPLPERVATTDFFHDAARAAVQHGLSFYILGGSEDQNARAVNRIRELYPNLKIVGRRNGYFLKENADEVINKIIRAKPDVLWVGLGKPYQEYWSKQNQNRLAGIGWIKTCGGLYAFLSGDAPRAPAWMQMAGLEWLFRTIRDPRRLLVRYLTTNIHASYRLLRHTERKV